MLKIIFATALSLSCWASLQEMTLEEKAGQVLMVHFNGEKVNDDAALLVKKLHVGGIIYYNWANGLLSPEQVLELSTGLQKLAQQSRLGIPLLIAVDQEGGLVARLSKGFTVFPGNKALGVAGDLSLAEQSAYVMGRELKAAGVNFNLAPVVDINSNPRNPVIGIRAFGDRAETVVPFAERALQGYHRAGVITSIKHFPGHGDVEIDSHEALPVVKKSKEQLQKMELVPFSMLASQADTVTTAHVMVPALDPRNCATLSKNVLDVLRKEMGFEGVIITDSLVMEGLLKNCSSIEDAAIRALNAGCDILDLGGKQLHGTQASYELTVADVERIHLALVHAVKEGVVAEARLDEAVQRILKLKSKYGLLAEKEAVNTLERRQLAKKIAALALKATVNKPIGSVKNKKLAVFAPPIVADQIKEAMLYDAESVLETGKKADVLVVFSYNAWKNKAHTALIGSLLELKKPLILVCLRDALDAALFPQADLILTTFSPTAPSIEAAWDFIAHLE